ncbi:olfactomedin-like protein 2B [Cololabis saira]|uniref:olfactomedin-like protein 2B n=1 Tax=Cololabis saira TaxID=129043 RepID=UPI002AD3411A|nr:olfactomedin-like protein 2B [Cololabis saira]
MRWPLLLLCCAVCSTDARAAPDAVAAGSSPGPSAGPEPVGPGRTAPPAAAGQDSPRGGEAAAADPLEDEDDNQENIISQLLGDYDKVKTVSSGSDCVCRCVVRPVKRSECSRILDVDPETPSQAFYTVETITKGTDCKKCVCMAPSSAVNPCEGEYRFKKLQDATKDDIKLATIMDLLEGSLYGMDLLKLQSVTTRLLTRVDNMEKIFTENLTERMREKERVKEKAKEKEKDKKAQLKKKKIVDAGLKSGALAYAQKQKNNDGQVKKNQQQDGLEQQQPARNETETHKPARDKNSVVVKGVTFYKAEEESYKENKEHKKGRGKNITLTTNASADSQISDKEPLTRTFLLKNTAPAPTEHHTSPSKTSSHSSPDHQPTASSTASTQITTTTGKPPPTRKPPPTVKPADEFTLTTLKETSTSQPTTSTGTVQPTMPVTLHMTSPSNTNVSAAADESPTALPQSKPRSRLSWTESPADQPKTTKKPGMCKDTVASISEPIQQNTYGLNEGTWMKDARGHGNVIYLTNGHYGNSLLEFRDMETFKSGQASNTYKLPYSYTGTGHVVFNGAFYYNRAFSRDIIKYDLRHRYVSAWTTLHDAILEEQVHRTQSEVEFAVDESGLWLLYPALDTEGFHQEVILLIHLHPRDLQPIRTFRTGLRRGRYGNSFLVCGVLYGVDSIERYYANVTYAFDTHTLTHTVPSLAITNMHTHTSQLAYCPLDKKLYAWDNGHQMMYSVIFAY